VFGAKKMLKVGVIGLGHMGMLHLMDCQHIEDIKIIATADKSKTALKRAESFGVKNLFTDYHDLLNGSPKVDAVVISLPNFLHFESIQLALKARLDVFVEKPLTNMVEECKRIVKLVEKSGRKLMVGHPQNSLKILALQFLRKHNLAHQKQPKIVVFHENKVE
jgi:predicted dehydrogenase